MAISIYNDFSDYMLFKGIKNVQTTDFKYKNIDVDITEDLVIKQFDAIYDFHQKSWGFNGYLRNRLNNNTGKIIEEYKIYIKKLVFDINNIKRDEPKNPFEELIIEYGEGAVKRGQACIRAVYQTDYIGIISRSMKRNEVCLGNTDFQNLQKENYTYVVNFEHCSYNMVEMDCFILLSKLRRKGAQLDFQRLANEFCYIEGLDTSSSEFLIALVSYPHEFMKCCNKYREGKNKDYEDRFSKKLLKALIQDGDSLF
ncbi:spore coat protein [Clostridium tagluense]|uniref:spore coat protein n=1 Tax=Clostridium tagluense TaxID=360422 RepID=UPI001CF25C11|nr:spore coat protein [Clostridium tagluense]MCB2311124.1 spore coat protein [Clostridium tagluense]MCB2315848.1 spore coat protein [Clostridium tagluense]MCB2320805.1 spore coat protein [Clostridium tagluense]MCB2325822.1 spore coat protein [Clostridium tagluense]MCB2330440.1 spore coat protein [Clostridium tagluense]